MAEVRGSNRPVAVAHILKVSEMWSGTPWKSGSVLALNAGQFYLAFLRLVGCERGCCYLRSAKQRKPAALQSDARRAFGASLTLYSLLMLLFYQDHVCKSEITSSTASAQRLHSPLATYQESALCYRWANM